MKKIAHYEFETPKIIGILSDRGVPASLLRKFDRIIKRKPAAYVCLPFKVEARYLKNVVACMRIMDIEGLIVIGDHERRIGKFMKAGRINVLKRTGNRLKGYHFENKETFHKDAVNLLTSNTSKKR
jgi:hypothetical protein